MCDRACVCGPGGDDACAVLFPPGQTSQGFLDSRQCETALADACGKATIDVDTCVGDMASAQCGGTTVTAVVLPDSCDPSP